MAGAYTFKIVLAMVSLVYVYTTTPRMMRKALGLTKTPSLGLTTERLSPAGHLYCKSLLEQTSESCFLAGESFSITNSTGIQFRMKKSACAECDQDDTVAEQAINLAYPGLAKVKEECHIYTVDGFLTKEQCQDLIQHANIPHKSAGLLQTSNVSLTEGDISEQESCSRLHKEVQNCSSFHLRNSFQSCPSSRSVNSLQSLHSKIKLVLPGLQVDDRIKAEPLVLTQYTAGGYYTEHVDGRRATVLIYLGGGGTEGATFFPNLDIRIHPEVGRAVIFFPNYDGEEGREKPCLSHVAEEVRSGKKWVAQVWLNSEVQFVQC